MPACQWGSLVPGVRCQEWLGKLSSPLCIQEVSPTFSDPARRNGQFQNEWRLESDNGEFTMEPLANSVTSQTQVPPWWWGVTLLPHWFLVWIETTPGRSPARGLPYISLQKCLFTAPQPPSPTTTPYGQYSAASLHVYQKENGMEVPREATSCPPGRPRPERPWFWAPSIFFDPKEGGWGRGGRIWAVALMLKVCHIQTPISADGLLMSDI